MNKIKFYISKSHLNNIEIKYLKYIYMTLKQNIAQLKVIEKTLRKQTSKILNI